MPETKQRFLFTVERRIVQAAEVCTKPGEITALLRREGVYWAYLSNWRKQFKKDGLAQKRRGPKPKTPEQKSAADKLSLMERQLAKMTARAERAEALVDLQKKWQRCWAAL